MKNLRRGGRAATAVAGSAVLLLATACSDNGDDAAADGDVELVIETFGNFGYEALIEEFEEETGYSVEHIVYGEQPDAAEALEQNLAAGSGAGDVVALEEAHITTMLAQVDQFVDLAEYGADEREDQYISWVWEKGVSPDGKLFGLGTDIGGMAMCYRHDLLEEAGLPHERDEVSELWGDSWEDYLAAGQEFRDADLDEAWLDDVGQIYTIITRQGGSAIYVDEDDELIFEDNPLVREAYDFAVELAEEDLSAGLDIWSDDWSAGIQSGAFATMPCPSWMLGLIEDYAGDDGHGLWDVADVPGPGGNWGGSHLAVTEQSEFPEQAAELAMYLTSVEGHLSAWEEASTLPSSPEALEDPAVTDFTREYFNDAPSGEIFGSGAMDLEPYYMGPGHIAIHDGIGDFIDDMQRGEMDPEEAWEAMVDEAERAVR
jgi:cellobiose transport system substrate-binding protein